MANENLRGGAGASNNQCGLPPHNPEPSTARGKRRHQNRNQDAKTKAEASWNKPRSNKESKYQRQLHGGRP